MIYLLYPLLLLAGSGFLLSVGAHVLSLANLPLPGGGTMGSALHTGAIALGFPMVLISNYLGRNSSRADILKVMFLGCPKWMPYTYKVLGGYVLINILLFAISHAANPPPVEAPASIRLFSSIWMLVYVLHFATFYSALHTWKNYRNQRCMNGHPVSPLARFCPECGVTLSTQIPAANSSNNHSP